MRHDADLRVGEHKAAHQLILQISFDRDSERFFRQTAPGLARHIIDIKPTTELLFRNKRFQHRVPGMFGEHTREIVKLFHLLVLRVIPGQIEHRLATHLFGNIAQEQTVVMAVPHVRCK